MTYNKTKMTEIISGLRALADELDEFMKLEMSGAAMVAGFISKILWSVAMLGIENLVIGLDK